MIGYTDGLFEEDEQLFLDVILKHRSNVKAFVYGKETDLSEELEGVGLKRVEGNL